MKTLLIALLILVPIISVAQENMGERLSSEVAEAVQGYIEKTQTVNDHTIVVIVPNEHIDFSLARSMISMVQHSMPDTRVYRTWNKDDDGYNLQLIISGEAYLVHYDGSFYRVVFD